MPEKRIRILHVEDSEDDAMLVMRELARAGYVPAFKRVYTRDAMNAALDAESWDVILADYSMPDFDAPSALSVAKERGLDLPFIIVSGTIGEDVAVQAMKLGAHDYILKDKLARLVPAIERELREAGVRAEQKRMRHELLIAERMAAIGTLAAGVAHEINNPLAALWANLDVMAHDLKHMDAEVVPKSWDSAESFGVWLSHLRDKAHALDESIQCAREAADRVRQIVSDLRAFSRPSDERRGPLDIHRVIDTAIRLALPELRHRAQLSRRYGDVPQVMGNEGRLTQVFLNLIVNAAQSAPPEGGSIRIVTDSLDDGRVSISVEDTGKGIAPEILPRIFDPFFTTKASGEGTGLGLAICNRIVRESNGEISVTSSPGKGATFTVTLPAASQFEDRASEVVPVSRGRLCILVIDDDALVAAAIRKLLALEHNVTAFTNSKTALLRIGGGERYDMILCDLLVSAPSAFEFCNVLERIASDQAQNVVFMSSGPIPINEESNQRDVAYIEKPIDAEALSALVCRFSERARRRAALRAS